MTIILNLRPAGNSDCLAGRYPAMLTPREPIPNCPILFTIFWRFSESFLLRFDGWKFLRGRFELVPAIVPSISSLSLFLAILWNCLHLISTFTGNTPTWSWKPARIPDTRFIPATESVLCALTERLVTSLSFWFSYTFYHVLWPRR